MLQFRRMAATHLVVMSMVMVLCLAFEAQAKGLVSNTLGSHMVLQRAPIQARLWGWTKQGGEKVEVTFDGANYPTVSSNDGAWRVDLPPKPAGGPYVIKIVSSDGDSAVLEDVYFGDVFICSGQSNMQFTVPSAFNASEEIAKANNYPHIRLFTVGQATISHDPLEELASIEQPWSVASSASVGHGQWSYFSALCWFFGRDIYDQHRIPVGLVSTNWGGTIVQAWSSSDALAKCGNPIPSSDSSSSSSPHKLITIKKQEEQGSATSSSSVGAPNPNQNSVLWNAMIVPFLPMRVRGAIWYQGESNVGNPKYYGCAFPEMIRDWRDKWQLNPSQLPFLFIQLAAYTQGGPYGYKLAETRYAQTKALSLPYVGMATGIDLGDLESPEGNIHPRDKQALGYRSKLIADRLIYGDQKVIYSGPVAKNVTVLSDGPAAVVRVHFFSQDAEGDRQPLLMPSSCPPSLKDTKECGWYDILTSSGKAFNATMVVVGEKDGVPFLELRAAVGSSEKAVGARYAYADWPVCTLYNKAGLPAPPFVFPPPF